MKNKSAEETKLEIREVTEDTLRLLGLSGVYKGFGYLIFGVELSIADQDVLTSVYKGLYLDTAKKFKTTAQCVERNIRTAREIIWKYGKKELRKEIFGERYQDTMPDNKNFVDALKGYIERQVNRNC